MSINVIKHQKMSKIVYRIGYCPPNPGPKAKLNCKWFTNVLELLDNYKEGDKVYVSHNGSKYQLADIEKIREEFFADEILKNI